MADIKTHFHLVSSERMYYSKTKGSKAEHYKEMFIMQF